MCSALAIFGKILVKRFALFAKFETQDTPKIVRAVYIKTNLKYKGL